MQGKRPAIVTLNEKRIAIDFNLNEDATLK
jgi:hypothetical protein